MLVVLAVACDRQIAAPPSLPPSITTTSERIGPGDVLEIRVREHADLTGTYQVGEDGHIRFPWIGPVAVMDQVPDAVAEAIEIRLAEGWLRQPQVAVLVHERQNREVSVLGQVKQPGSFPYRQRLTLVQAISQAGGMNPLAQTKRVTVTRETASGRQTIEVDVNAIIDSRASDLVLEPGDIVFVPESPI